jgi:hypothetical protein
VRLETSRTACYSAIVDKNGECHFGVGDMDINNRITPKLVRFWPVERSRASGAIYYNITYKPVSLVNISVENGISCPRIDCLMSSSGLFFDLMNTYTLTDFHNYLL